MVSDASPENAPDGLNLTTALILGRARHHGRPWGAPARALLRSCGQKQTAETQDDPEEPMAPAPNGHFLIIDNRFGTPIHVFLELDPSTEPGFPGFRVRSVTLELPAGAPGMGVPAGIAIGQDPHHLDRFRMFRTERAVATAGFILIEPRYVGPNWPAYLLAFRPGGERCGKRPG